MTRRPPRSTRTDTPFPYTTLFRSHVLGNRGRPFAAPSDTGVDRTLPRPFRHGLGSSPQPYSRKTEEAWDSSCRYTVGPAARGHSRMVVAFRGRARSEEHTSELQSLMRHPYAVFCLTKKKNNH